jgi:acyl dehydratase
MALTESGHQLDLTDKDFEEASKLLGVELRRTSYSGVNTSAAFDNIIHFCDGVSDENPLHRDREYGRNSKYGSIVAPYMFLLTIDRGIAGPGLPGIQYIAGGTEHAFVRPVLLDEPLAARVKLADVQWREGKTVGRFIDQVAETTYRNTDTDEVVGTSLHHVFRVPRRPKDGSGRGYVTREIQHYSAEDIDDIYAAIDREVIRGAETRYAEDVQVGEEITPLIKPVLAITDILQWYAGAGTLYRAHEMAFKHRRRHPGDSHPDHRTGVPGHPGRGHLEADMAKAAGMPGVYDVGNQRISWLAQMLEYWMGDDGHLAQHDIRVVRPNIEGDTSWCKGTVLEVKPKDDSVSTVVIDVWVENQHGEKTAKGRSEVELPRRG